MGVLTYRFIRITVAAGDAIKEKGKISCKKDKKNARRGEALEREGIRDGFFQGILA